MLGVVDGASVVVGEQEEPDHLGVVGLKDVLNIQDIAQRFAHLGLIDVDEPVVNPISNEGLACGGFGLGNLVVVVRELEVTTPSVDVEGLAQVVAAHD